MTKEVDVKNQIWFEKDGKFVRLGLTRNFLQSMDECWHILPSNMVHIKEKAPLFTIETNDGIMSLLSPVTGNMYNWDSKAANFPDKLTENDVLLTLTSDAVKDTVSADAEFNAAVARLRRDGIEPPRPVVRNTAGRITTNFSFAELRNVANAQAPTDGDWIRHQIEQQRQAVLQSLQQPTTASVRPHAPTRATLQPPAPLQFFDEEDNV